MILLENVHLKKRIDKVNVGQHFYKRYDGVVNFIANILDKI